MLGMGKNGVGLCAVRDVWILAVPRAGLLRELAVRSSEALPAKAAGAPLSICATNPVPAAVGQLVLLGVLSRRFVRQSAISLREDLEAVRNARPHVADLCRRRCHRHFQPVGDGDDAVVACVMDGGKVEPHRALKRLHGSGKEGGGHGGHVLVVFNEVTGISRHRNCRGLRSVLKAVALDDAIDDVVRRFGIVHGHHVASVPDDEEVQLPVALREAEGLSGGRPPHVAVRHLPVHEIRPIQVVERSLRIEEIADQVEFPVEKDRSHAALQDGTDFRRDAKPILILQSVPGFVAALFPLRARDIRRPGVGVDSSGDL
eukprot:scaffold576_cov260-Pinguiococcus_pyrenoidosus.AAC.106